MCGRTRLAVPPSDLADVFEATLSPEAAAHADEAVNLNCAPTDPILVVRRARDSDTRELVVMRWGLVPFYVHDFRDSKPLINARVETVATNRAFRDSFKKRRCLILADGFYEWHAKQGAKKKSPYAIKRPSGEPFAMAGIWDRHPPTRIETCAILTCPPTEAVAALHDRMPVAIEKSDHGAWLDPATDALALRDILARRVGDWVVTAIDRVPDSSIVKSQMKLFA
jgi:putative SOS response-associated peptidase YedK